MKARVEVMLKTGVLDPQGAAIAQSLATLGFDGVEAVRQGKLFEIELEAADPETAKAEVERMCEQLLANTVIERYSVEIA